MFNGISASAAFGVTEQELADWIGAAEERREWMTIKFSEFNGNEFDIATMSFKERGK